MTKIDKGKLRKESWDSLNLPLGPQGPLPAQIEDIIGPGLDVLLIGITADYYKIGKTLTAIDLSKWMIDTVWAGNTVDRQAINADWLVMPFAESSFDCVLGDGSLSNIPFNNIPDVLAEITRILRPGGKLIHRSFCSPDQPETLIEVVNQAFAGTIGSYEAFRLQLYMAMAHETQSMNIKSRDVLAAFNRLVPNRNDFSIATKWPRKVIDLIDIRMDANLTYTFPTRSVLKKLTEEFFGKVSIVESCTYALSDRCPIFVMEEAKFS